jgi:hypothetical protein
MNKLRFVAGINCHCSTSAVLPIFNVHERLIVGQNRSFFEERLRYHHRLHGRKEAAR